MLNYKNIIDDFKKIADEHKQINSFGTGDIRQLIYLTQEKQGQANTEDNAPTYPLMFVLAPSVQRNEQYLTYTFSVVIADILNAKNYNNETDVLSDTLQMAEDILAQFKYSVTNAQGDYEQKYDVQFPANIQSFSEAYDDLLAGWTLTINVVIDNPLNRCIAPYKPFN